MAQATAEFNATRINPFIQSVVQVLETMLAMTPQRKELSVGRGDLTGNGLSTLVGISGAFAGVVVLHFSGDTAIKLAERFVGVEFADLNEEVVDAMSELTNMVAGAAKAKFPSDPPAELSLPSVVQGQNYRLNYPSSAIWIRIPFATELGDFMMEVTFSAKHA